MTRENKLMGYKYIPDTSQLLSFAAIRKNINPVITPKYMWIGNYGYYRQ